MSMAELKTIFSNYKSMRNPKIKKRLLNKLLDKGFSTDDEVSRTPDKDLMTIPGLGRGMLSHLRTVIPFDERACARTKNQKYVDEEPMRADIDTPLSLENKRLRQLNEEHEKTISDLEEKLEFQANLIENMRHGRPEAEGGTERAKLLEQNRKLKNLVISLLQD
jgi:hypothetical protein